MDKTHAFLVMVLLSGIPKAKVKLVCILITAKRLTAFTRNAFALFCVRHFVLNKFFFCFFI